MSSLFFRVDIHGIELPAGRDSLGYKIQVCSLRAMAGVQWLHCIR